MCHHQYSVHNNKNECYEVRVLKQFHWIWFHVLSFSYGLHTLSSFQGGNAHCTAGNILQQLLWHAFREVFPG